jgi:hypothetical protein
MLHRIRSRTEKQQTFCVGAFLLKIGMNEAIKLNVYQENARWSRPDFLDSVYEYLNFPIPAFTRLGTMYPSTLLPHVFFPTGKRCVRLSVRTKSVVQSQIVYNSGSESYLSIYSGSVFVPDPDHTLKLKMPNFSV